MMLRFDAAPSSRSKIRAIRGFDPSRLLLSRGEIPPDIVAAERWRNACVVRGATEARLHALAVSTSYRRGYRTSHILRRARGRLRPIRVVKMRRFGNSTPADSYFKR